MKEKYLQVTTSFITRYHTYSDYDLEKLRYGLEGLYLSITKLVVIITISILLGMFKELCLLLILFNIIRFTGFGFHARKSYECLICSTVLFIGLPLLMKGLNLDKIFLLVIGSVCVIILAIYAPADTVKRPLPNRKKRVIRKIATVVIAISYVLLVMFIKDNTIGYLLITSLMLEAIMVNPLTYKIFRQPYRNYLTYQTT